MAARFRARDRSAPAADWSGLIRELPCDLPGISVEPAEIKKVLGEPDLETRLPDGSLSLEYVLGYSFRLGNREERRLVIQITRAQRCRCLTTTRQDRNRATP